MSPGPTFDRVYLALKEQLTSGEFAPGDHLEPAVLGEGLNSSITPVRDALHRLLGERIVEAPRNDGYRVPAPTEAELRHLYGWSRDLLDLALRRRASVAIGDAAGVPGLHPAELFLRIAGLSGNPEQEAAVANLNDRLGTWRVAEKCLFQDLDEELGALTALVQNEHAGPLRRALAVYHRRRQRHAPELLLIARSRRRG